MGSDWWDRADGWSSMENDKMCFANPRFVFLWWLHGDWSFRGILLREHPPCCFLHACHSESLSPSSKYKMTGSSQTTVISAGHGFQTVCACQPWWHKKLKRRVILPPSKIEQIYSIRNRIAIQWVFHWNLSSELKDFFYFNIFFHFVT